MTAIYGFLDAARADDIRWADGTSKARWARVITANPNGDPVSRYVAPSSPLREHSILSTALTQL